MKIKLKRRRFDLQAGPGVQITQADANAIIGIDPDSVPAGPIPDPLTVNVLNVLDEANIDTLNVTGDAFFVYVESDYVYAAGLEVSGTATLAYIAGGSADFSGALTCDSLDVATTATIDHIAGGSADFSGALTCDTLTVDGVQYVRTEVETCTGSIFVLAEV